MVAQLEHQFRLGRLSVQGLWFFCQVSFILLHLLSLIIGFSIKTYVSLWQRMMSSLNALAVLVEKATSNNTSGSATLNILQSQVILQNEFMSPTFHRVPSVRPSFPLILMDLANR